MRNSIRILIATFLFFVRSLSAVAGKNVEEEHQEVNIPGERPFDGVNIFGDLRRMEELSDTHENKLWWERMARGEVGKDRFFILCALKDGDWKSLADIRTYLEFHLQEGYSAKRLYNMLVLMAGRRYPKMIPRKATSSRFVPGEGWLEKNPSGDYSLVNTGWRIAPSVLPLLYFLLMGGPQNDRCN